MSSEGADRVPMWASTGDLTSNDEGFETENLLADSISTVESANMPPNAILKNFSEFGDSECGEPMRAQHFIIDFTLDKNIDTDESQQKVCDFWAYINSRPDIQHLMVLPDSSMPKSESAFDLGQHSVILNVPNERDITAVSMLELCDDYGATSRAFDMKNCTTKCSQENIDYFEDRDKGKPRLTKYPICKCPRSWKCAKKPTKKDTKKPGVSSQSVVAMCSQLDDWDKKHPKPMGPPGPVYQHLPILQRKLQPPI